MAARCEEDRFRQVHGRQPRLDVRPLAEEVASLILLRQEDDRLKWYDDGRVRVVVGKVLPDGSAVTQTLAGRRKRFHEALGEPLAVEGWREVGVVHVFGPGGSPVSSAGKIGGSSGTTTEGCE